MLKAAAGLSDEELTWRMETAKPEANAYRIASAALQRAEATYERLLWRQVRHEKLMGEGGKGWLTDRPAAQCKIEELSIKTEFLRPKMSGPRCQRRISKSALPAWGTECVPRKHDVVRKEAALVCSSGEFPCFCFSVRGTQRGLSE